MIERTYRCNLCREKCEPQELVGLHWNSFPKGWTENQSPIAVENHICKACLSSLQALEQRCGQGFKCDGGPNCGSDHK